MCGPGGLEPWTRAGTSEEPEGEAGGQRWAEAELPGERGREGARKEGSREGENACEVLRKRNAGQQNPALV